MSLSRNEADAQLAAIAEVVAQVRQSRIYRVSGAIAMMWGGLQFVQYGVAVLWPMDVSWSWMPVDAVGVALTVLMLGRARLPRGRGIARALAAFALFYGFGFVWTGLLAPFDGREVSVFWHTLFLFGYCLAGLWFGSGFLAIGLGLTAAILAVYFFAGALFWPLLAVVSGAGYILCGYWMRRT